MAVDEAADLGGKQMEEGGLELRQGREGWRWGDARAGRRRESVGPDRRQDSGLEFGYDAGSSRFISRPGVEEKTGDVAEEAEEVELRRAQET